MPRASCISPLRLAATPPASHRPSAAFPTPNQATEDAHGTLSSYGFHTNVKMTAFTTTMTEPKASPSTWRKTPRMLSCDDESVSASISSKSVPGLLGFPLFAFSPVGVPPAVRVAVASAGVPVKQAEPQQVDQEPRRADPGDHLGTVDLVGLGETLDRLQHDGEAQRREEDGVDQSPHHLRPDPAERVLVGGLGLLGKPHGHQSHDQRDHIGQHVKGVRQHRQRRSDATDHHLHHEEGESQ
uniref:Uncharacterized protein n=1 Tax=Oryzias melastigma TaxID=30732 RepID=A0A3B3BFD7_ORYME